MSDPNNPFESRDLKSRLDPEKSPFESYDLNSHLDPAKSAFESHDLKPHLEPEKNPFESRDLKPHLEPEKNPFESRDLKSRVDLNAGSNGTVEYTGGERRHHSRRAKKDRRTEIRFEIDKEGRRENQGRRFDDEEDVSR